MLLTKDTYFCEMQDFIQFKNSKIYFSVEGKGTAVVLIHGFLENATMWNKITPELTKRNKVITIDLLGHGKTDCLGYVHTMELYAETVQAVLKHLKLRKYILIGHSLGGYVALAFAKKHPQKIKGLCLVNSTSDEDSKERKKLRTRANKMIQNNFTNMVRMSFANLFGEKSKTIFKEEIKLALHEALQTPVQGYIAGQEGMRIRANTNHVLADNNFKKLLIIGEKDPVLDYKTSLEEAKKTNSEIVVFPNGHMSHIENKIELITALKEFVKG
jgi:pimeloyl-ACP methyl ester carboxylesterase